MSLLSPAFLELYERTGAWKMNNARRRLDEIFSTPRYKSRHETGNSTEKSYILNPTAPQQHREILHSKSYITEISFNQTPRIKSRAGNFQNVKCDIPRPAEAVPKRRRSRKKKKVDADEQPTITPTTRTTGSPSISEDIDVEPRAFDDCVEQTVKNAKIKNETIKETNDDGKTFIVKSWFVRFTKKNTIFIEGDIASDANGLYEPGNSSSIARRINARTLQTKSGNIYKIFRKINEKKAINSGLSKSVIDKFKNGFPPNWQSVIESNNLKFHVGNSTIESHVEHQMENNSTCKMSTSSIDMSILPRTRSGRVVVPPLDFWRLQRLAIFKDKDPFVYSPAHPIVKKSPASDKKVYKIDDSKPKVKQQTLQKASDDKINDESNSTNKPLISDNPNSQMIESFRGLLDCSVRLDLIEVNRIELNAEKRCLRSTSSNLKGSPSKFQEQFKDDSYEVSKNEKGLQKITKSNRSRRPQNQESNADSETDSTNMSDISDSKSSNKKRRTINRSAEKSNERNEERKTAKNKTKTEVPKSKKVMEIDVIAGRDTLKFRNQLMDFIQSNSRDDNSDNDDIFSATPFRNKCTVQGLAGIRLNEIDSDVEGGTTAEVHTPQVLFGSDKLTACNFMVPTSAKRTPNLSTGATPFVLKENSETYKRNVDRYIWKYQKQKKKSGKVETRSELKVVEQTNAPVFCPPLKLPSRLNFSQSVKLYDTDEDEDEKDHYFSDMEN